ncbi:tetratricopeptide repeat protein [bacterium]|nr:tetratricopeptide repeat protein [bacterium]
MEGKYYATCLWPGLTELWWRGRLSALPYALVFTCFLNLYLISRFFYPEWIPSILVSVGFWVGLPIWCFCFLRDFKEMPSLIAPREVSETPDTFSEARCHYLQGQWNEAEGLLTDMLAIDPRDPPALLLLAGLYRNTQRLEAAGLLIREMKKLESSETWWLEVQTEERRIESARSENESTKDGSSTD